MTSDMATLENGEVGEGKEDEKEDREDVDPIDADDSEDVDDPINDPDPEARSSAMAKGGHKI